MTKRAYLPLTAIFTASLTAILCTTLAAQNHNQTQTPAAPKAQIQPDQKAYNAARATADPDQKLAALRQFLTDFPDSTRKGAAHSAILTVLLDHFPQRTADIDTEAQAQLKGSKGFSKWSQEVSLALRLANAQPAGADLPRAQKYAQDALKHETTPKLTKAYLGFFKGQPAPKPAEVQAFLKERRADALGASASVAFRQGRIAEATAQLDEAYPLAPLDNDLNALRAEIAYSQHRNADALAFLERAQVSGSISKPNRELLAKLYADADPSGDLAATLDTRYRELYPAPFTPAPHTPVAGGHTALLELYTGSGCPPCVGGDLAVEALLASHPRTELVALAYDLHIPRPDPLTSPDTVDRAAFYSVTSTPNYILDGKKFSTIYGADREGADELYARLVKLVDEQTRKPSSVQLQLTATPGSTIAAQATVTLGDPASLAAPSLPVEPPDPSDKKPNKDKKPTPSPAKPTPSPAKPTPNPANPIKLAEPKYVLNFALVEDDVRYSGENGVRFHRMVVRALAKPSAEGFSLQPGSSVTLDATFNLADIARKSREYLDTYEKSNTRFGPIEFLAKPTEPAPRHLAIAAWIQDPESHRVLQSAFYPLAVSETATR